MSQAPNVNAAVEKSNPRSFPIEKNLRTAFGLAFDVWMKDAVIYDDCIEVQTQHVADHIVNKHGSKLIAAYGHMPEVRVRGQKDMAKKVPAPIPIQVDVPPANKTLPVWPDTARGCPNGFIRSAIFTATDGKNRLLLNDALVASNGQYEVYFSGEQLNQADLDVWLEAIHLVRFIDIDETYEITQNAFLKLLGLTNGGDNYATLKMILKRLHKVSIELKVSEKWMCFHLIEECFGNDEQETIHIRFSSTLLKLFTVNSWTGIEKEQRRILKKKPLALWLHGFYSTHKTPYPMKVETLHKLSGSQTKEKKHFKSALKRAFKDLAKIGMVGNIEGDLVFVERQ